MLKVSPVEQLRLSFTAARGKASESTLLLRFLIARSAVPSRLERIAFVQTHQRVIATVVRLRESVQTTRRCAPQTNGVPDSATELAKADRRWTTDAETEIRQLRASIQIPQSAFHHVGSTAVDGLTAKAIIDIAVEVPDQYLAEKLQWVRRQFAVCGYRYLGVRGGFLFAKYNGQVRTHAVQLHGRGSEGLRELLQFRDDLITDTTLRKAYEETKLALASCFPRSRRLYAYYKFHWIAEHQWRAAGAADWTDWFIAHKRRQAALARQARQQRISP